MNKQKLTTILMVIGLFMVIISPVLDRYLTLSDTLRGFLTGLGIGMLALSVFIKMKLRAGG